MRGGIPLLNSNELSYFHNGSAEKIWPSPIPGSTSGKFLIDADNDKNSEPRGDFKNHDVYIPKIYTYCITAYLCFI
jgi:hypothetical protein